MPSQLVSKENQAPAAPPPESGLANISTAASDLQKTGKVKAQLPGAVGSRKPPVNKFLVIGILIALIFALGTLIFVTLAKNSQGGSSNDPRLKPTPTLVPKPSAVTQTLGQPTEYFEDPQILQLQTLINTHAAQMDTVDLTEPITDPPKVETKIEFE